MTLIRLPWHLSTSLGLRGVAKRRPQGANSTNGRGCGKVARFDISRHCFYTSPRFIFINHDYEKAKELPIIRVPIRDWMLQMATTFVNMTISIKDDTAYLSVSTVRNR